jgi:PAS domain-containing protein
MGGTLIRTENGAAAGCSVVRVTFFAYGGGCALLLRSWRPHELWPNVLPSLLCPTPNRGRSKKENTRLRQQQTDAEQQQAADQRYERSQDRFSTVFENSPQGQKVIGPDLVIRQARPF